MIRQAPGFRGCKALEEASIKHKLFHIYLFISGPTQKGKGKDTPCGCNSINIFVKKKGGGRGGNNKEEEIFTRKQEKRCITNLVRGWRWSYAEGGGGGGGGVGVIAEV
jgi:hypothetical protein